jgi:hypothetical protein
MPAATMRLLMLVRTGRDGCEPLVDDADGV